MAARPPTPCSAERSVALREQQVARNSELVRIAVVTVTQPDLARLIEQRPEIQKAQADVQAADAAVRLTQAARGLQVALDGAATQTFAPNVQTAYSIGASVSFPLSDAGRAAAEVAQATASLQAARARLEAARLTALQGGVSALLNLNSAAGRIQSARASLALAEESLRLAQGRYAAGVVAIFAVTDAQTTVLEAEVALAGAEFDQVAGVLQLRHALGRSVVDGTI
jgi:outer membrane protein TolC